MYSKLIFAANPLAQHHRCATVQVPENHRNIYTPLATRGQVREQALRPLVRDRTGSQTTREPVHSVRTVIRRGGSGVLLL